MELDSKRKAKKIGIIGASVNGLSAAQYLVDAGYEVKLFEKDHESGGICQTEFIVDDDNNRRGFDLMTAFVLLLSPQGAEVLPTLTEYIKRFNLEKDLIPINEGYGLFDRDTHTWNAWGPSAISQEQLIKELVIYFNLLEKLCALNTYEEWFSSGAVLAGESLEEWGKRNGCPVIAQKFAFRRDLQGGWGPSLGLSAAKSLRDYHTWYLGIIFDTLLQAKIPPTVIAEHFPGWIVDAYQNIISGQVPYYYIFRLGYQSFFDAWVKHSRFNIAYGTAGTVTQLEGTTIKTADGLTHVFDKVIVTAGAEPTLKFLSSKAPAYSYLTEIFIPDPICYGIFCKVKPRKEKPLFIILPTIKQLGTHNLPLEVMALFNLNIETDYVVVAKYGPKIVSDDEHRILLKKQLGDLGYDDVEFVKAVPAPYNEQIPLNREKEWHSQFERLQGKDNVYYLWHFFTGLGVPQGMHQAHMYMKKWFPIKENVRNIHEDVKDAAYSF